MAEINCGCEDTIPPLSSISSVAAYSLIQIFIHSSFIHSDQQELGSARGMQVQKLPRQRQPLLSQSLHSISQRQTTGNPKLTYRSVTQRLLDAEDWLAKYLF